MSREPVTREALERVIRACAGNFDHLSGEAKTNANVFNEALALLVEAVNDDRIRMDDLENRIAALEP